MCNLSSSLPLPGAAVWASDQGVGGGATDRGHPAGEMQAGLWDRKHDQHQVCGVCLALALSLSLSLSLSHSRSLSLSLSLAGSFSPSLAHSLSGWLILSVSLPLSLAFSLLLSLSLSLSRSLWLSCSPWLSCPLSLSFSFSPAQVMSALLCFEYL